MMLVWEGPATCRMELRSSVTSEILEAAIDHKVFESRNRPGKTILRTSRNQHIRLSRIACPRVQTKLELLLRSALSFALDRHTRVFARVPHEK